MISILKEVLPEAVMGRMGKWHYKEWTICPMCGFVKDEGGKTIRFRRGDLEMFRDVLNQIK